MLCGKAAYQMTIGILTLPPHSTHIEQTYRIIINVFIYAYIYNIALL